MPHSVFAQSCASVLLMPSSCCLLPLALTPALCPGHRTHASSPCLGVWLLDIRAFVCFIPACMEAQPMSVTGTFSLGEEEEPSSVCPGKLASHCHPGNRSDYLLCNSQGALRVPWKSSTKHGCSALLEAGVAQEGRLLRGGKSCIRQGRGKGHPSRRSIHFSTDTEWEPALCWAR